MRISFDEQLKLLHNDMIIMGALCEEVITGAVEALLDYDSDNTEQDSDVAWAKQNRFEQITQKIFEKDKDIDRMEREIESLCFKLILQQQPVAKDLRRISAALKMISDMERIGDQASDIAEIIKYIPNSSLRHKIHMREMSKAAAEMVTKSVDAYVKDDVELARKVIASDDEVDDLFRQIRSELISEVSKDASRGEECIDLMMIAKYFERIGDHATNIAEWVEYSVTGVHRNSEI